MSILDKFINELTKEDWITLYHENGMTLTSLAKHYKVNPTTIMNRLKKEGIKRRSEGKKIEVTIPKEELVKLYVDNKMTLAKIGKEYSCTDKTVKKNLALHGISLRKRAGQVLTKDFLDREMKKNRNVREVSESTGFSIPVVYKYLYKYELLEKDISDPLYLEIKAMYLRGKTTTEISKEISRSLGFINTALAALQVTVRRKPGNSKIDYEQAERMYVSGNSLAEIVEYFGGGNKSILADKLRARGVKIRSKSDALKGLHNAMQGNRHTVKAREAMSAAYYSGIRDISNNKIGNPEVFYSPLQGEVKARSSWEASVGRYLNSKGVSYLFEPYRIKLEVDGVVCSYLPDFKVIPEKGECYYIEVKGMTEKYSMDKLNAAIESGHKIELWDREKLVKLKIVSSSGAALY